MENKEKLFLFFIINWINNPRNEKLDAFIRYLDKNYIKERVSELCGPIACKKYTCLANLSHRNTTLKEETKGKRNHWLRLFLIKGNYMFTWLNPKNNKSHKLKLR